MTFLFSTTRPRAGRLLGGSALGGGQLGPQLTVCGAAASVSISSCVSQTFPVVWATPVTTHVQSEGAGTERKGGRHVSRGCAGGRRPPLRRRFSAAGCPPPENQRALATPRGPGTRSTAQLLELSLPCSPPDFMCGLYREETTWRPSGKLSFSGNCGFKTFARSSPNKRNKERRTEPSFGARGDGSGQVSRRDRALGRDGRGREQRWAGEGGPGAVRCRSEARDGPAAGRSSPPLAKQWPSRPFTTTSGKLPRHLHF